MTENGSSFTLEEQVRGLIEQLDDYINHYHGGSVELVSFNGTDAVIRLGGACQECPLSPSTGYGWIAGTLKQFFPEIVTVKMAEDLTD